ncbi:uncharacterized protein LOC120326293 [Styela clava]
MDLQRTIRYEPILIYQVPFCPPFWTTETNFTGPIPSSKTLWSHLPQSCQMSNAIAAGVASFIAVFCVFIHVATLVAYSSLQHNIIERELRSTDDKKNGIRRRTDFSAIKEAADYAFAMKTQARLRKTFAVSGLLSGGLLLPIVVASTAAAYSRPFPHSVFHETLDSLRSYSVTISVLFHLTLTSSLCTLLLMVVERLRETLRMCPDHFFKSPAQDTSSLKKKHANDMTDSAVSSRKNTGSSRRSEKWKRNSDIFNFNEKLKIEETVLYAFKQSYTAIDLVMTLFVPALTGIVTTLAVAVFEAHFELFGLVVNGSPQSDRMPSINGLISYKYGSYPDSVYTYSATIGIILVAIIFANFVSVLRCYTLMSIARYLPGFHHTRDLFKFNEQKKNGNSRNNRPRAFSRIISPDSVRLARKKSWSKGQNRQDPDGLSIDSKDETFLEDSLSSLPLPPLPDPSRHSVMSMDNLSLPPPPRPESMADIPERSLDIAFPSLPSIARREERIEIEEPPAKDLATVKAEAFFGNVRQSKVVTTTFLLFILLSLPLLVLFASGVFYPHDSRLFSVMGGPINYTNLTSKMADPIRAVPQIKEEIESSGYVEPTPPDNHKYTEPVLITAVVDNGRDEKAFKQMQNSATQKNWVTTLAAVFLILFALSNVAPFFAYCAASRKFRCEVKRFFCFCLCFRWNRYGKHNKKLSDEDIVRSRTNRTLSTNNSMRVSSRGPRDRSSLPRDSMRHSFKYYNRGYNRPPLRREKTFAAPRNVSWEMPDFGTARL